MKTILAVLAACVVLWLVDRVFRARTQSLRDSGILPPPGEGTEADVERLLARGRKIDAIKLHREIHGTGLKESKEAVEKLARRMRNEGPG